MAQWRFRPKAEDEILSDPIQDRFFTTSDVGNFTTGLVRESIQNSLDARSDKETDPAIVRFYLSTTESECSEYLTGLLSHLRSKKSGIREDLLPDISGSIPYILIEDYNTTGLEGNPMESVDPDENDTNKHNFYWFWRNDSRSGKGENDIGRWGVGKTVFPASSKINTFFGLTVRQEDEQKLLLGKSVLKFHENIEDNVWYCPYGFFGKYSHDRSLPEPLNENEDNVDRADDFTSPRRSKLTTLRR